MGFSERELTLIKSALRYYDEQMVCSDDIDKIVDKVNFWIAVEQFNSGKDINEDYFESLSSIF